MQNAIHNCKKKGLILTTVILYILSVVSCISLMKTLCYKITKNKVVLMVVYLLTSYKRTQWDV
jgi:hypothetical protein